MVCAQDTSAVGTDKGASAWLEIGRHFGQFGSHMRGDAAVEDLLNQGGQFLSGLVVDSTRRQRPSDAAGQHVQTVAVNIGVLRPVSEYRQDRRTVADGSVGNLGYRHPSSPHAIDDRHPGLELE